ncbi:MAG: 1-acyl-sn-glycerol-3-phosphate acyltransferase [Bacilli bacterium]|nr:1-acyl-sn-glycerol-3-phosphate acyltransferase [Bacilli bacterium]
MFDPKTHRYPFPEDTASHYLVVKKNDGTVFDANYPYLDKSKAMAFKRFWARVGLTLLVFPVARVYLGLKIVGRKNLKIHKAVLDGGFLTVSNHIHLWDYISIMKAIRPRKPNVLIWAPNIRGENGKMMRAVGGIPIPEDDIGATRAYMEAVKEVLQGGVLQIYPEGSMWEYYAPVRPFKRGPSYFAIKHDKPILPMGFSYRKPGWFRRVVMRQEAAITLTIGEPIWANPELKGKEKENDLTIRCHQAVCRLCGIDPSENLYGPIYDNSKRIDYYD